MNNNPNKDDSTGNEPTPATNSDFESVGVVDILQQEILELKAKLEKVEAEKENAMRSAAEYENARKRAQRDMEIEKKFAHAKFAADLLMAFDNLDRAIDAAREINEQNSLIQGVSATQNQILDVLKRHGVQLIDCLEKPFDPNLHQAVQMKPSKEHPANIVVQVLQKGFLIHDRVLRPATVIVTTPE